MNGDQQNYITSWTMQERQQLNQCRHQYGFDPQVLAILFPNKPVQDMKKQHYENYQTEQLKQVNSKYFTNFKAVLRRVSGKLTTQSRQTIRLNNASTSTISQMQQQLQKLNTRKQQAYDDDQTQQQSIQMNELLQATETKISPILTNNIQQIHQLRPSYKGIQDCLQQIQSSLKQYNDVKVQLSTEAQAKNAEQSKILENLNKQLDTCQTFADKFREIYKLPKK